MGEWDTGYVDEIAYTFGYCDELNPLRLTLPLLHAGLAPPIVDAACELGFGHGVSVNIHAAGSTTQWYGTDFHAPHANFAQQLADSAGSQAQLFGERFSEFCARDDLPDFDFIGMHGIWSWVSDENRALLADFIQRKLKTGGVLYLSYNTQPGWTAMLPVRELMHQHFQLATLNESQSGVLGEERMQARIKSAVGFAQAVFAAQPGYAVVNPLLAERVEALSGESATYLAHEYFNRDWHPMSYLQAASSLIAAGLTYGGSADYRDHVDALNLTAAQRTLLAEIADTGLRETTRDFCVNRSLRRDYWVKNPRTLGDGEREAALRAHRVILALPRAAVVLKVRGALGETALPEALYGPILDALSNHLPAALSEIENRVRAHGIDLAQIVEAVMLLIGMGALLNAQEDAQVAAAQPSAAKLNAAICEGARHRDEVQFLVSPVSGSGIFMPRIAQLFLLARLQNLQQPAQWAEFAASALGSGAEAASATTTTAAASSAAEPSLAELTAKAHRFAEVHLPILQALRIA
ncbi:class I SAM-dependent methyltransferase [Paraburkholderia phenazinium]|uniref:Predicted methyltransferase regulatory domain-containing protein n=1 Tax=Paraburkholderia phenazinium TaxID=60549 RepID=A0A1G8N4T4_9BURK|nr:class I SAM-dependent methyltransferase [Paraburkholderia phenazinium]SDI75125.1 Predicted methyltransferase regulatory domain-containing protein [Paraburkholderia phenazinium]